MSAPNALASSSKTHQKEKSKRQQKDKDGLKSKHKHHSKDGVSSSKKHEKSSSSKSSPFEHRLSKMRLSIPPKYAGDWLIGAREVLDGMLMRFVPQMSGVLLAHWEHEFLDDTVKIIDECPYGVCEVQFRSVIWAPKIGQKLYGTHSLSSPSHLSLLFARTFNISIPLQHIPQDLFKFEHSDSPDDQDSDSEDENDEDDDAVEEVGRWRNVQTGQLVGEEGVKGIKFTVIGMQVINQILSLTGSLLPDPTNPPPPPSPTIPIRAPSPSPSASPEPVSQRPTKVARTSQPEKATKTSQHSAAAPVEPEDDVIDDQFLSARELKQKRKEQEKKKRDARKAKKEEKALEHVEQIGAEAMVNMSGVDAEGPPQVQSVKRKAKSDEPSGAGQKKRKVADA